MICARRATRKQRTGTFAAAPRNIRKRIIEELIVTSQLWNRHFITVLLIYVQYDDIGCLVYFWVILFIGKRGQKVQNSSKKSICYPNQPGNVALLGQIIYFHLRISILHDRYIPDLHDLAHVADWNYIIFMIYDMFRWLDLYYTDPSQRMKMTG